MNPHDTHQNQSTDELNKLHTHLAESEQSKSEIITQLNRIEKEQQIFTHLAIRLAASDSVSEMNMIICDESFNLLEWDAYYFALRKPGSDILIVDSFVDTINGVKKSFPADQWSITRETKSLIPVLDGQTILLNRPAGITEPAFERFGDSSHSSASLMYAPVRSGDKVIGIISAQSYTVNKYAEKDLETLLHIADLVAPALARAFILEKLRESEARYRAIVEDQTELICRFLPGGPITFVNEAFCRYYNKNKEDFVGQIFKALIPEGDLSRIQRKRASLTLEKNVINYEIRVLLSENSPRWQHWTERAIYNKQHQIVEFQAVGYDVTDRKLAERRQRMLSDGLRAVLICADELNTCHDVDAIYLKAVELGRVKLHLERCGILIEKDGQVYGTYGTNFQGVTTDERLHKAPMNDMWTAHFQLRDSNEPLWEVFEDNYSYWNGSMMVKGDKGWIVATPIQTADRTIGVFFNDTAISRAPLDDVKQEILAVFCSLLGDIIVRKLAEEELALALLQMRKSRDDMLSILNQLRLCTAITDKNGYITFLSSLGQRLFGKTFESVVGKHWEQVFPFSEEERKALRSMSEHPPEKRFKLPVSFEDPQHKRYWMEVDVQDDPHNPKRKIFFLYDVSEIHGLRRFLDENVQFHGLVGKSKPMQLIYQQIGEIASVDSTVLIEGETGTGKELVARAIHNLSHRKNKSFLAINCAGLTESLLTSQLFGHKKGSFTGAIEHHQGLFEAAQGGTIFLDEIGDITMSLQTNLLRVLEEKEIIRVGETKSRKIDVRVIAATNRSLIAEVEKNNFRADLFYRIRVARIHLPPLKERREDIPLLVEHFIKQHNLLTSKPIHGLSNDAMRVLLDYTWPGNVRELKNAIEYALIRSSGSVLASIDLPPEILEHLSGRTAEESLPDEEQRLLAALKKSKGNRTEAAQLLGMSRATFYRHLSKLNQTPE